MIADAYGFDPRGGRGERIYGRSEEPFFVKSVALIKDGLVCPVGVRKARGFFFRGELTRSVFDYMASVGVAGYERTNERSSGEAIRQVVSSRRFDRGGLLLLGRC